MAWSAPIFFLFLFFFFLFCCLLYKCVFFFFPFFDKPFKMPPSGSTDDWRFSREIETEVYIVHYSYQIYNCWSVFVSVFWWLVRWLDTGLSPPHHTHTHILLLISSSSPPISLVLFYLYGNRSSFCMEPVGVCDEWRWRDLVPTSPA